jgi:DNA-binding beta-propeller fold protein YncE
MLIAPVPPAAAVTLQPGDILVADRDSTDGSGAVIKVDPITGRQSLVSSNATSGGPDLFSQPQEIAVSASGRILVTDLTSEEGSGAVIVVDPATGEQTAVSNKHDLRARPVRRTDWCLRRAAKMLRPLRDGRR